MKHFLQGDEWRIIENGFHPTFNRVAESIFCLGNGRMGLRGYFEESYGGDTHPGSYFAGIYVEEETAPAHKRVGLPGHAARMLNAANWIGAQIAFDGEPLDLHRCEIREFQRILHLREGYLERRFLARLQSGKEIRVRGRRFCSMNEHELAALEYAIEPLNFTGTLTLTPFIDFNVKNERSWRDELLWVEVETLVKREQAYVVAESKTTGFQLCSGMRFSVHQDGAPVSCNAFRIQREKYAACSVDLLCREGQETALYKYVANISSAHHPKKGLLERCREKTKAAALAGFEALFEAHRAVWAEIWAQRDVVIEGDPAAQQGMRFGIFHLAQAFNGAEGKWSLSPRGLTGERRGGCVFWSAEAFGLPYFLANAGAHMARDLLFFRYRQLPKAIDNAELLGFKNGAALYPMMTIDGREGNADWELALCAVHRNGAIVYALYRYYQYTGDWEFMENHGLEMLVAIARFWAQRVHFSSHQQAYVIHSVTGPNEYENNVNNNWYTNYLARWCLRFTLRMLEEARRRPVAYRALVERLYFNELAETKYWSDIIERMYLPNDERQGIFPQQDGYLNKELPAVDTLRPEDRPLRQKWSWDRIMRSGFVMRADVLQGLYWFEEDFDEKAIRRNFDFYYARTVHESALSPATHAAVAARLGLLDKASELFQQAVRLDLADWHGDTAEGCHITSMAGAWLALAEGFAGLRIREHRLVLHPTLPPSWKAYSFHARYREANLWIRVDRQEISIRNLGPKPCEILIFQQVQCIETQQSLRLDWSPPA